MRLAAGPRTASHQFMKARSLEFPLAPSEPRPDLLLRLDLRRNACHQSASSLPCLMHLVAFFLCAKPDAAHRWTTPGGRVEGGESPVMALETRSVLEEIGCEVQACTSNRRLREAIS